MLDKLSEKVLKYIVKNCSDDVLIDFDKLYKNLNIAPRFINEICRQLTAQGYIKAIFADDEVCAVVLNLKGATYFSEKRRDILSKIYVLLGSKIADAIFPLLISFLTSMLINLILSA